MVVSFREEHPEAPKNWCSNRVKESAVHTASGWIVSADVLAANGELHLVPKEAALSYLCWLHAAILKWHEADIATYHAVVERPLHLD